MDHAQGGLLYHRFIKPKSKIKNLFGGERGKLEKKGVTALLIRANPHFTILSPFFLTRTNWSQKPCHDEWDEDH
jgi:hypothetical protein